MKTLLAALLVASSVLGQAQQAPTKSAPQQGPPPKNLSVRADGHVSANQDPANADKFEVHVVKQGETLSQIAGEALKNPGMWPQLWEQNEHIINPHWIYPNDKILVRPVTAITEAKPPEAPAEAPAVVAAPVAEGPARPAPVPTPATPAPGTAGLDLVFDVEKPVSEVKFDDLYCSGFARTSAVPKDLKVISKFDASGGVLAAETDYVYLSHGSEDGIATGNIYQVIRPTTMLTDPNGRTKATRELGMHYLDVAQLRVVLVQPDFSMGRIMHSCGDAVEVGDIMVPFLKIALPRRDRSRKFSPMMTTNSGIKGIVVSTKNVMLNFGSTFKLSGEIPGVRGSDRLGAMERGIAAEGAILYINIGQDKGVKPGDVFVVYREDAADPRLYDVPKEIAKLKGRRTAIGELVVIKVGERASTALVTYATDGLSLGDAVERR